MTNILAAEIQRSEMRIPKSFIGTFSYFIFISIIASFALLGSISAAYNLILFKQMSIPTLVVSAIWLLFIFYSIRQSCRDQGGVRQFFINCLGTFAMHQFVEITMQDSSRKVLRFGYQLFAKRFYYLKDVQCDRIKTVNWSLGQATSLAGRDMNDWSVVLWFENDSESPLAWEPPNKALHGISHAVRIVGPSRKKYKTEELGNKFIKFLRDADVISEKYNNIALDALIHTSGLTSTGSIPIGKVNLAGNYYYAQSIKGTFEKDTEVRVIERRGLTLYVAPTTDPNV